MPASGGTDEGARDGARVFLKAIGKRAAATVKEVAASARQAVEAKTQSGDQRTVAPQAAGMAQAMPKRRLWLWIAGVFGMVFILGLCIAGGIIALGLRAISPKAGDNQQASAATDEAHPWLRRIELTGEGQGAWQIAFLPDGHRVLSMETHDCRLWDVESGKEVRNLLHNEPGHLLGLCLSPDGRLGLLGVELKGVRLLDVEAGQEVGSIADDYGLAGMGFSQDSRRAFFTRPHTKTEASGRTISIDGKDTEAAAEIAKMGPDGFKNLKVWPATKNLQHTLAFGLFPFDNRSMQEAKYSTYELRLRAI
ncbi:MAG: WD40 repeat domain-containing protein, partial [Acidobacteriota bacterium]